MLTLDAFILFSSSSMWNNLFKAPYCGRVQNSIPHIFICKPVMILLLQQRTDRTQKVGSVHRTSLYLCSLIYKITLCSQECIYEYACNITLSGFVFPNVFQLTVQTVGLLENFQKFMYIPTLRQSFSILSEQFTNRSGALCCAEELQGSFTQAAVSFARGSLSWGNVPSMMSPWQACGTCPCLMVEDGKPSSLQAESPPEMGILGAKTQFGNHEV